MPTRHVIIECAYTNEHPGGSVQLSNERKLSSEAGSDANKFAMEVLFRVRTAACAPPLATSFYKNKWEV